MNLTKFIGDIKVVHLLSGLLLISFAACSNLVLKPANYAWPVESVLKVDNHGFATEIRNSISFNTKDLFLAETGDSSAYMNKEIRLIRDMNGYYYITSDNFKNVYVFKSEEGKLALVDKILITKTGLENPAFNQRQPYIELVSGSQKYYLTNDGITDNKTASSNISMKEGEK